MPLGSQINQKESQMNWEHQILVYADVNYKYYKGNPTRCIYS